MRNSIALLAIVGIVLIGCTNNAASTGSDPDASDITHGTDAITADSSALPDTADTVGADALTNETVTPVCACGDGKCDAACQESAASCPKDCAVCGDGKCAAGEGPLACPVDCCGACGDGVCGGAPCKEDIETCAADCAVTCSNGVCDAAESSLNCPADCEVHTCGNHVCEAGESGTDGCAADCAPLCGNCACDPKETWANCPQDCGYCGDGVCSDCADLGETTKSCTADCKSTSCTDGGISCDDGVACTVDKCESSGACSHTATASACDDGKGCTQDSCDPVKGCSHLASDGPCDDGSACSYNDQCQEGLCKGMDGCGGSPSLPGGGATGGTCSSPVSGCKVQMATTNYDATFGIVCSDGKTITIQVGGAAGQNGDNGKDGGPCQPGGNGGQGSPGKFPDLKALACTDCKVTDLTGYIKLVTCGTSTRQVLRGSDGANGLNGAAGTPPPGSPGCP